MSEHREIAKLVVGGREFTRWQSYSIESNIMTPANAFSFRATNRNGEMAGLIHKGDRVDVLVDDQLQMKGYIDDIDFDTSGDYVDITGRDGFLFLADCSAPMGQLEKQTLLTLAKRLSADWIDDLMWCTQDGITLTQIDHVKIEPGELIMDVLKRYADIDRVLIWMDPDGTAVIGRPNYADEPVFALRRFSSESHRRNENNVVSGGVHHSIRENFSSIIVVGSSSNTSQSYADKSSYEGKIEDDTIAVKRTRIISSSDVKTLKQAREEAERQRGRGRYEGWKGEYTARGHYNSDQLWRVDALVDLIDERTGEHGSRYIERRRFNDDGQGKFTELTLRPVGEYLP